MTYKTSSHKPIPRYLPHASQKVSFRPKLRDGIYIIICSLIFTGLLRTGEKSLTALMPRHAIVTGSVLAYETKVTPTPQTIVKYLEVKNDDRSKRLQEYLESQKSPLAPYAGYIVAKSDEQGIDWTLIVSIAGKESSYGTNCPKGKHNPFGLGGSNFMSFESWEDAIDYEAKLLNSYYRENMIAGIQSDYCPSYECASNWTSSVVSFAKDILAVK